MSKGDGRRPSSVSKAEYDKNYEAAFGKKKLVGNEDTYACPRCGATFWWANDPLFGGKNRCDNCGHTWEDRDEQEECELLLTVLCDEPGGGED